MHHVADVDGYRVEIHQCTQASSASDGSWYLAIGVADSPLRWRSQHQFLSDARQFAADVVAAVGPDATHEQLGAYVTGAVR